MFKKIFFIVPLSLFTVLLCAAQPPAREAQLVGQLAEAFRAMPSYEVRFEVAAGEYVSRGSYAVAGSGYYLRVGDAEVFSDGRTRYEVDNRRREVTINPVDSASRNLLANPVRAFDFLGDAFHPSLLWERSGKASVRLHPVKGSGAATGDITVTMTTDPVRPLSLMYDYDGEHVGVAILSVAPLAEPLPAFDTDRYPAYELIDFR